MLSVMRNRCMPEAKSMNIAMVGTGFIARAHSDAFQQVGRFFGVAFARQLKVVCGRDPSRVADFARQWEWQETAAKWESVVGRPDIDIVDIAAPNALHAPVAIAAARAGKIVFCEKPLALSVAEAEGMAGTVGKRPHSLWV